MSSRITKTAVATLIAAAAIGLTACQSNGSDDAGASSYGQDTLTGLTNVPGWVAPDWSRMAPPNGH